MNYIYFLNDFRPQCRKSDCLRDCFTLATNRCRRQFHAGLISGIVPFFIHKREFSLDFTNFHDAFICLMFCQTNIHSCNLCMLFRCGILRPFWHFFFNLCYFRCAWFEIWECVIVNLWNQFVLTMLGCITLKFWIECQGYLEKLHLCQYVTPFMTSSCSLKMNITSVSFLCDFRSTSL